MPIADAQDDRGIGRVGTTSDLDPAPPGIDEGRSYDIAKIHDIGSSGVPSPMKAAPSGHGSTTNLSRGGTCPMPWAFQSGAEREYRPTRALLNACESAAAPSDWKLTWRQVLAGSEALP